MKQLKGVIFDFNGTLFWDGSKHQEAWSMMAERLRGTPLSEEEMTEHIHGQINTKIVSYLLGYSLRDEEAKAHSLEKEAVYRALCEKDPAFLHLAPGAEELFNKLQNRRIPQSIATASIYENVAFFRKTFHLSKWFDKEHITYDDGVNKDKTDMFLNAARVMNIPIEECLIIEDSLSGIQFANEIHAGMIIALAPAEKAKSYQSLPGVSSVIQDFVDFDTNIFAEVKTCD